MYEGLEIANGKEPKVGPEKTKIERQEREKSSKLLDESLNWQRRSGGITKDSCSRLLCSIRTLPLKFECTFNSWRISCMIIMSSYVCVGMKLPRARNSKDTQAIMHTKAIASDEHCPGQLSQHQWQCIRQWRAKQSRYEEGVTQTSIDISKIWKHRARSTKCIATKPYRNRGTKKKIETTSCKLLRQRLTDNTEPKRVEPVSTCFS